MKKLLALLILLSAGLHSYALTGDDEKGFTLGVGLGICNDTHHFGNGKKSHHIFLMGSVRAGYRITPDFEAGIVVGVRDDEGSSSLLSGGIYGEYCFKRAGQFRMFVDGDFIAILPHNYYSEAGKEGCEFGFRPGIAYKFKNVPIELKLRYLFIGFNNTSRGFRTDACLGRGDWIVDAGLNRLEIGASVTF